MVNFFLHLNISERYASFPVRVGMLFKSEWGRLERKEVIRISWVGRRRDFLKL